ncbi:hypothetical protein [Halomontanus rarus]|uniref:hypothetical protein n=1 Tax=Halomontanus rarus TaxID=3034020 RepID=UPI001A980456
MVQETDLDRDRDAIRELLYRLRPGDEVAVATNASWSGGRDGTRKMRIETVTLETSPADGEEYYRIYGKGKRQRQQEESGSYVLMPEKPSGKGNHPAPEGYHRTPNSDAEYQETTGGAITGIEVSR